MENKQLETSGNRKPRVSKGKLKRSTTINKKCKRQSQGFSTSFTQKTLHNNTLLAQSLAKEKSRHEKFVVAYQELMASRNEAMMRLIESEASFDRLGMLVRTGCKQLHDLTATLEEVMAEICVSKNNPRDSASMRSSWDETVSSAGHAIMKQPLPHVNGMQEKVTVNDQSSQWPLCAPSRPVSPIEEEESEMTSSDDDTLREDSLICRRAPTRREPTKKSTPDGEGPLQPPRPIRRVGGGMMKLLGYDFSSTSSWSAEYDVHNRTSLSLVDMDETVVHGEPTMQDGASHRTGLSFNTVTKDRVDEESPEDLSYDEVFCVQPKNKESRGVAKMNALPDPTTNIGRARRSVVSPQLPEANCESSERQARTDSPDFLGFSNDNINWPNRISVSMSPSIEESSIVPCTSDFFGLPNGNSTSPKEHLRKKPHDGTSSSINNSKIHNKSPNIAQKQSKSSSAVHPNSKSSKVKVSVSSLPPGGNVLNSDSSKKAVHNPKQSKPKLTKSLSLSKSTIGLEQLNPSEHHSEVPELSEASLKRPTRLPTTTSDGDISAKSNTEDLTSLKTPSTPAVRVARLSKTTSHVREHTRSPTLPPPKSTPNNSSKLQAGNVNLNPRVVLTRLVLETRKSINETPDWSRETPSETRSADDLGRAPPARPATSRSAEVPRGPRPIGRSRRNTQDSGPRSRTLKRALTLDDTPSRGPEAKSPKGRATLLVNGLHDSPGCSSSSTIEKDASGRRTRRRIGQANYKEQSLNTKLRRPVSKDHV